MNMHNDYVRAMSFSQQCGKLFTVSDDGKLAISDLNQMKLAKEFNLHANKHKLYRNKYVPVY